MAASPALLRAALPRVLAWSSPRAAAVARAAAAARAGGVAGSVPQRRFCAVEAAQAGGALEPAAGGGLLPVDADAWLAWRPVPAPEAPRELELEEDAMTLHEDEGLAARLAVAFAPEVAAVAFEVACRPELRQHWSTVTKRLMQVELDALDSVLVLHCMVRLRCRDRRLLSKVVDQIEGRYFSMELGIPTGHKAMELFPPREEEEMPDGFRALVDRLPVDHKIKIVIMDNVGREDGRLREKPLPPEPDGRKKWRNVDPVEMEAWEREQFEKGRLWVKRLRHVEATVNRMRPGNKLAATLALQLLQVLPAAAPATLAELAQICAFFPKVRPLHGDLLEDFREALSRRVTALDTHQVRPHALAFASGMRDFGGPEAYRAWRRKLVPAVLQVLSTTRSQLGLQVFDLQSGFHSHLRGVPHRAAVESSPSGDAEALQRHAERAASLFLAVATARQVDLDCELFDALAAPLKVALRQQLHGSAAGGAPVASSGHLLPLETLADVLDACISCGVDDAGAELPRLLLELFQVQFGDDIREGRFALSGYAMTDLSAMSHAASVLSGAGGAEEALALLWLAAEPKLRSSQPHLVLMLLDALVRGGSEELLTSPALAAAVDEHLVQRLDFDTSRLGRLGL